MTARIRIEVWPAEGTTVTLLSGFVITAAGADALYTDEIDALLKSQKLKSEDPTRLNPHPRPIPPGKQGGASTVVPATLLSSALSPSDGTLGATHGTASANDAGAGFFYFDAGSESVVDNALVVAHSHGRWKRIRNDSMLNVKWFGAVGDGNSHPLSDYFPSLAAAQAVYPFIAKRAGGPLGLNESDAACLARYQIDFCAIKKALNSCVSWAGGIFIPRGRYLINETIKCGQTDNGVVGIAVRGENLAPSMALGDTLLLWVGDDKDAPAFWFSGINYHIEGLQFQADSGKTLYSAIEFGSLTTAIKTNTTSRFKDISVRGKQVGEPIGEIAHGITFGTKCPSFNNLENCILQHCSFLQCTDSDFYIGSGQPYNTIVYACNFASSGNPRGTGVYIAGTGGTGSITISQCDFQSKEVALRILNSNLCATVTGGEMEGCKKAFYGTYFGPASTGAVISFVGPMRVNNSKAGNATANFAAADTAMFVNLLSNQLLLTACCADDVTVPFGIHTKKGSAVICDMCSFAANDPFTHENDFGIMTMGIWTRACNQMFRGGVSATVKPFPTLVGSINPSGLAAPLAGARAMTLVVKLPKDELVADYKVRLDVERVSGRPASGALCGYVTDITPSGFCITVPTPPGAGSSVTYRYTTWR